MAKLWPTPHGLTANQGQGDGEFGKAIRHAPGGFSPVVSPARTFLLPERERDYQERGLVFGGNIIDSLTSFDRDTQSWRTSQHSMFGGLTLFSDRWPNSGLMRNGIASRRQTWVLLTEGRESGLLPTPKSSPSGPDFARMNRDGSGGDDLATAAARFPTPTANDGEKDGTNTLARQIQTGSNKGRRTPEITGQLNPTWVDWLMGYPIGWTDLEDSVTPLSLR